MTVNLEETTWTELDRLDRNRALILIPISPIEEHGPHLPLGTDIMAAVDIAQGAARKLTDLAPDWTVILNPAVPLGCAAITADFPGTLSLRGTTLRDVVRDISTAWVRHGFRYLLFCNHHLDPVHMKAILSAIEDIEAQHAVHIAETMSRSVYAGLENEAIAHGQAMGLDMRYEIHADAKETAYMRFRRPELVRQLAGRLDSVKIDVRQGLRDGRPTFRQMGAEHGYIGSPGQSDPEFGRLYLDECVRQTVELALKLIHGDPLPPIDPRMKAFLTDHVQLD